MGKVAVAVMVAFGAGAFATTLLSGFLGTQAEAAALSLAGLGLLGAGQLFAVKPFKETSVEAAREKVPA